jgi:hypothetical protein
MRRPLALTDPQMQMILCRACSIRPHWRSRWLALVADFLMGLDHIVDSDVASAIARATAAIGRGEAA